MQTHCHLSSGVDRRCEGLHEWGGGAGAAPIQSVLQSAPDSSFPPSAGARLPFLKGSQVVSLPFLAPGDTRGHFSEVGQGLALSWT